MNWIHSFIAIFIIISSTSSIAQSISYVKSFGSYGNGNGQFNNPWGIATDSSGDVYVADWLNARVQVFDSVGTFICRFFVKTATCPRAIPTFLSD